MLKTAQTIRDYEADFRGWKFTVPAGSTVCNQVAGGHDDNYRFLAWFHTLAKEVTGTNHSTLAHDLTYYGLNIPAEYCEPYPES